jgi:hypothetical protein
MPVNQSDSVCLACGAPPGGRHTASCSSVSEKVVHATDGQSQEPMYKEKDKAVMPTSLAERQVKAMESIAMSLDRLVLVAEAGLSDDQRHWLTTVVQRQATRRSD